MNSGIPSSPSDFNVYLTDICRQAQTEKLPLDLAVSLVQHIKSILPKLPHDGQEKARLIINLASLVHLLPASQDFNELFNDKNFWSSLIRFSVSNPQINEIYVVLSSYLKGDFLLEKGTPSTPVNDYYRVLLTVFVENTTFLRNIAKRFRHPDQNLANVGSHFLASLYCPLCWPENKEFTLRILTTFSENGLAQLYRKCVFETKYLPTATYGALILNILRNLEVAFEMMATVPYDYRTSPALNDILNTICVAVRDYAHFNIKGLTNSQIYINMGLTSNPKEYLYKTFDTVTLMSVDAFFKDPSAKSFSFECKKQHSLLGGFIYRFPLVKFVCELSKLLRVKFFSHTNPQYPIIFHFEIYTLEILLLLLNKALSYWENSKASTDHNEDFLFILNLLKMDLQYLNINLTNMDDFLIALTKLATELNYDRIKQVQLRFLKEDQYLTYLSDKDLEAYNEDLLDSVKLFVINERLMELTKGLLCYSENPAGYRSLKDVPKLFMTVTPKRNSIVFAKLGRDTDWKKIQRQSPYEIVESHENKQFFIRAIKKVVTERITSNKIMGLLERDVKMSNDVIKSLARGGAEGTNSAKNYISISSKNIITRIILVGSSNETLFTFYTDTHRSATLCSDTFNLLIDNFKFTNVTPETISHIEQLFDIKVTLQFLPLASIFNHKIIDMYTSVKTKDPINYNLGDYENKDDDTDNNGQENFLLIKNINFSDLESELTPKPVQIQLRKEHAAASKKNGNGETSSSEVIKEGQDENGDEPSQGNFEYSYDELLDAASGFYYN